MKDLTNEQLNIATKDDVGFFLSCTNEGDIRFQRLVSFFNIAICEWIGWRYTTSGPDNDKYCGWEKPGGCFPQPPENLPSHILGIEALGNMHEAENGMTEEHRIQYLRHLTQLEHYGRFATARQRAIALLRVVKPELFQ